MGSNVGSNSGGTTIVGDNGRERARWISEADEQRIIRALKGDDVLGWLRYNTIPEAVEHIVGRLAQSVPKEDYDEAVLRGDLFHVRAMFAEARLGVIAHEVDVFHETTGR